MKKKRWFAALAYALLLATQLPGAAVAADSYNLWINGVQITGDNAGDVLENGTVSYNAGTKTLTLNGANLNQVHEASYSAAIYTEENLHIVLENSNEISVNSGKNSCCGIYVGGKLTIDGEGALNVRATSAALSNYAIAIGYAGEDFEINNGAVTLYASGSDGYGVYNQRFGNMKINGGAVEIKGEECAAFMNMNLDGYTGCSVISSPNIDGSNPWAYDPNNFFYYKYFKVYTYAPNYDEYGFNGNSCEPAERNDGGTPEDSSDDWYQITNAGNLFWFNALLKSDATKAGANARLTKHITIPNGKNWIPLSVGAYGTGYEGTFDGQGFSISNLSIQQDGWAEVSTGLFKGVKANGVVKNLSLKSVDVNMPGNSVGAICGWNDGLVENCHIISGSVKGASEAGGICGDNTGTITKCSNAAAVDKAPNGYDYYGFGGICGSQSGAAAQITYCYNTGNITADYNAGGICGEQNGGKTISCYNIGTITNGSPISSAHSGIPAIQQCCWLAEAETETGGKTAAQFASGEVAYALNGKSSADTVVWKQTVSGENAQPYPAFHGGVVYCGYAFCYSETVSYANDSTKVFAQRPSHVMQEATCTEPAKCRNAGCTHTEGSAKGHAYDDDADMICNDCFYDRTVTYTVTYDNNGGDGTMANGTATSGVAFALPACAFTAPAGQRFKEWAIGGTSGAKVAANGTHAFAADTTVYAVWESIPPDPIIEGPINVPQTGDPSTPALWLWIALMAGAGITAIVIRRKRQNG